MKRADGGFTLLEALVALAILGVVMATVYGVIGSGLRAAHRDEDRLLLGLVAQNLLVRSRLDLDPAAGSRSGDIGGGLRWRIESEPYVLPPDILPEAPRGAEPGGSAPADDKKGASPYFSSAASAAGSSDTGATGRDREALGAKPMEAGRTSSMSETGRPDASGETDQREGAAQREPVRLRLVTVTVEKGDQRFVLSGLAAEPRRERPATR